MSVRTRFAPSPTGFLHVGGVRTALFSWLYARHYGGEFILRIEDTDKERSTAESVEAILDGMNWLGLTCDEGPIYQTDRYVRYHEMAQRLLDEGHAYRCTCSKERLESLRAAQLEAKEKPRYDGHCRGLNLGTEEPHCVIRFKNPQQGSVSFIDRVYGEIEVKNSELDDLILIRTDGYPTYNFAVVIDDWDMQITHVIRGDDHINNTPRQINLFKAFNAPVPVFAHLPMILGDDGKRLSKRHGAVSILQFKEEGYLPHALLNYLVRLGWSSGDEEIFSLEEMIARFDLDNISRGVAGFNYEKLNWLNQHYIKNDPPQQVAEALRWQYAYQGIDVSEGPALKDVVLVWADRCKTLADMAQKTRCFFQDALSYDEESVKKYLRPVALEPLTLLYTRLQTVQSWNAESIQQVINEVCVTLDLGMGKIAQPLRVAVMGSGMSPAIDKTLELLGQLRTLSRLQEALLRIKVQTSE